MKPAKFNGVIESHDHLRQIIAELGAASVFCKPMLYKTPRVVMSYEYKELYCRRCGELILPTIEKDGYWSRVAAHNARKYCSKKCDWLSRDGGRCKQKAQKCKCGEEDPDKFYKTKTSRSTCMNCRKKAARANRIRHTVNNKDRLIAMGETARDGVIMDESHLQNIIDTLGVDAVFGRQIRFLASNGGVDTRTYEARYCDQHDKPKLILPKIGKGGRWTTKADHDRQLTCNRKCAHLRYKKHRGTQITSKTKHNPVKLHSHDSENPADQFLYGLNK